MPENIGLPRRSGSRHQMREIPSSVTASPVHPRCALLVMSFSSSGMMPELLEVPWSGSTSLGGGAVRLSSSEAEEMSMRMWRDDGGGMGPACSLKPLRPRPVCPAPKARVVRAPPGFAPGLIKAPPALTSASGSLLVSPKSCRSCVAGASVSASGECRGGA